MFFYMTKEDTKESSINECIILFGEKEFSFEFEGYIYIQEAEISPNTNMKSLRNDKWEVSKAELQSRKDLRDISTWEYLNSKGINISDKYILNGCIRGGFTSVTKFIIERGKFDSATLSKALNNAVELNNSELVIVLIKAGAKISKAALSTAFNINLGIARILIEHGGDIQFDNNTLLRSAVWKNNIESVKLLLESGADVHVWNDYVLEYASEKGYIEIVNLLLRHGEELHTSKGLREAVKNGNLDIVKVLIEGGADIHAFKNEALRLAIKNNHNTITKVLVNNGADIHIEEDLGFRMAAKEGNFEMVNFFFKSGANIYAGNDYALRWSITNNHVEIVKFLLEVGADVYSSYDSLIEWASKSNETIKNVIRVFKFS